LLGELSEANRSGAKLDGVNVPERSVHVAVPCTGCIFNIVMKYSSIILGE